MQVDFLFDAYEEIIGDEPLSFLELGCGPAQHSLEMAESKLKVYCVDAATEMIEYAAALAAEDDLEMTCIEGDMRDFRLPVRPSSSPPTICPVRHPTLIEARQWLRHGRAPLYYLARPVGLLLHACLQPPPRRPVQPHLTLIPLCTAASLPALPFFSAGTRRASGAHRVHLEPMCVSAVCACMLRRRGHGCASRLRVLC